MHKKLIVLTTIHSDEISWYLGLPADKNKNKPHRTSVGRLVVPFSFSMWLIHNLFRVSSISLTVTFGCKRNLMTDARPECPGGHGSSDIHLFTAINHSTSGTVLCKSPAKEDSFEWQHQRALFTDLKVTTINNFTAIWSGA